MFLQSKTPRRTRQKAPRRYRSWHIETSYAQKRVVWNLFMQMIDLWKWDHPSYYHELSKMNVFVWCVLPTPPKFNSSTLKSHRIPKRKVLPSNHPWLRGSCWTLGVYHLLSGMSPYECQRSSELTQLPLVPEAGKQHHLIKIYIDIGSCLNTDSQWRFSEGYVIFLGFPSFKKMNRYIICLPTKGDICICYTLFFWTLKCVGFLSMPCFLWKNRHVCGS